MKNIFLKSIILVLGVMFFCACSPKISQNKGDYLRESVEETSFVGFIENTRFHQKIKIDSLLNLAKTKISNLGKDELIFPLDSVIESDSSRVVVIGKFINKTDVFALDIHGTWDKQHIYFYKYENETWEKLQSDNFNGDILDFRFENFNTDEDAEILILGHPNMNGNRENTIYKFDESDN